MSHDLCEILLQKLEHEVERCIHLGSLIPADKVRWVPPVPKGIRLSQLLTHFCECLAGFAAVLYAAHPEELSPLADLKRLLADECVSVHDAAGRMGQFRGGVRKGFEVLRDEDLSRRIPTVFVQTGEPILALLLINFEHLASHKYQLFVYLRILGVQVESRDLYHFSGE